MLTTGLEWTGAMPTFNVTHTMTQRSIHVHVYKIVITLILKPWFEWEKNTYMYVPNCYRQRLSAASVPIFVKLILQISLINIIVVGDNIPAP